MYGVKPDQDFSFLVGKRLYQVCFGMNEVIFNFDECISICVTSPLGFSQDGSSPQRYENFRAAAHLMVQLLHQDIISATPGDDRKTLALAFGDTSVLELYDDSDHYESFVIQYGDGEIIVV